MDKEQAIISKFHSHFIGDDGAVVGNLVFSKDLFAENSHFKRGWLTPYEIGKKAIAVNISDAVVMNAHPKYALLGLMAPKSITMSEISAIRNGICDECAKFGVEVIGGDTISADILALSVTIVSCIPAGAKPIFRKNPKNGYLLAFTGHLGGSQKGLKTLQNGGNLSSNSRFKNVILRDKFFYKIAKFTHSAMDISDGLASDLLKFMPKKGIKFTKKLTNLELTSGEEYEILLSCDKRHKKRLENEAKKARVALTFFGEVTDGRIKIKRKKEHF